MKDLDKDDARMIKDHINELRQDPYTPRPQCDILREKGKRPPLYRLRIGRHRAEYSLKEIRFSSPRCFRDQAIRTIGRFIRNKE